MRGGRAYTRSKSNEFGGVLISYIWKSLEIKNDNPIGPGWVGGGTLQLDSDPIMNENILIL